MYKKIIFFTVIFLIAAVSLTPLIQPARGQESETCTDQDYMEDVAADVQTLSQLFTTEMTNDPVALGQVSLSFIEARQSYEDTEIEEPACQVINIMMMMTLANVQDVITLRLAAHGDPDSAATYEERTEQQIERVQILVGKLQEVFGAEPK